MFTSKEVLEKTGISRATLNNYISWGLVPKPQVLPPQANDGAAPRIGYFPDDILERIAQVQQLKRDGLSISQISARFAGKPAQAVPALTTALPTAQPAPEPTRPPRQPAPISFAAPATPALPLEEITHPAYLVNSRFEVVWANEGARARTWPNHVPLSAGPEAPNVFKFLMRDAADKAADAVLGLHLGLARQRGLAVADVCRGVRTEQGALLASLYDRATTLELPMVVRVRVDPADLTAPTSPSPGDAYLYALTFAKATLFIYVPDEGSHFSLGQWLPPEPAAQAAPMLTDVAVLACDLQDARGLWAELPAGEYFELVNEVWLTVEPIFRRHGGTTGKHPGEGLVCYFLAQESPAHLWSAVAAAQEIRVAVENISRQWRLRKGWVRDLHLNTGIDEGQEWRGRLRAGSDAGFSMLGESVHRALRISAFARDGAVWLTKNLVEKLPAATRERLKFGVRHRTETGEMVLVASTFARVEYAGGTDALVAELIAISVPDTDRAAGPSPA
ncbi:MerR family transcriptional regulator [Caenimonas sp. SL110]|uniref:MerR family transcriptional regulator n=1 Tax=Caenimonas sp. SL110 TaxID=1450524 RepID=UPI000653D3D0|nr:MerR family transcriptional regulator [Caenimonas sp. SL110]